MTVNYKVVCSECGKFIRGNRRSKVITHSYHKTCAKKIMNRLYRLKKQGKI